MSDGFMNRQLKSFDIFRKLPKDHSQGSLLGLFSKFSVSQQNPNSDYRMFRVVYHSGIKRVTGILGVLGPKRIRGRPQIRKQ